MDKTQSVQEEQYDFPYHYIPDTTNGFLELRVLNWGYQYLSYLEFIIDNLGTMEFQSLIDIGCGDGRFIHEFVKKYPNKKIVGTDYSDRAIAFAKAFNPNVEISKSTNDKFDAFTLIEVMEHIHPKELDSFLESIKENLLPGAFGIITTPTTNISLKSKHYQHFDQETFQKILSRHFKLESVQFLNSKSVGEKIIKHLLSNRFFTVSNKKISTFFYNFYKRKYLMSSASKGTRITAIVRYTN